MCCEKNRIELVIDALQPQGDILEIGFGNGYSAECIQRHKPKSHTIIEQDPELFRNALEWSKRYERTFVFQGSWHVILSQLHQFNLILIWEQQDTILFAPSNDEQTLAASGLLQKENKLLQFVLEKIPDLSKIKYADEDIDIFFHTIAAAQAKEASLFLSELKSREQITVEQYTRCIQKYGLTNEPPKNKQNDIRKHSNPLLALLSACLQSHLHAGGRVACLLKEGTSHYEDPEFFEQMITDPHIDYQEKSLSIVEGDAFPLMVVEKMH